MDISGNNKVEEFLYLLKLMSKERKVDELLPKVEQSNGQKRKMDIIYHHLAL